LCPRGIIHHRDDFTSAWATIHAHASSLFIYSHSITAYPAWAQNNVPILGYSVNRAAYRKLKLAPTGLVRMWRNKQ
jgi:hypothetical protein